MSRLTATLKKLPVDIYFHPVIINQSLNSLISNKEIYDVAKLVHGNSFQVIMILYIWNYHLWFATCSSH